MRKFLKSALSAQSLLLVLCGLLAAPAVLQAEEVIEEIVVTGSFIRGTPQDAALPVDVLSREDFEDAGNPSITELVRNLGIANGNLGETNQFNGSGGQGNEGVSTINLRGLGSARSLVLLNGRRHVAQPTSGVDISAIPTVAIERLEVLKDGAAALYGSDAIAGVVNFITRDDFDGFELRGSGQFLDDSDGEFDVGAIWGFSGDRMRVSVSGEWSSRSKLQIRDRDWAIRPQSENPQGGYSTIGNPGRLFPITPAGPAGFIADPGCQDVGGTLAGSTCFFQFTQFDNLIEEQDTYKVFAEVNYDINENVEFHAEALYSKMDMPEWNTSPSYPPQALFGPDRQVPLDHPGLVDLQSRYPGVIPADTVALITWSRLTGWGGLLGEPGEASRETDTFRLSTGLNGSLFDDAIGFDFAVSWSRRDRETTGLDMFAERMGFALRGLGGPNCDQATGTPGVGSCSYYTPFSNGVRGNAITGALNPNATPALVDANEALFPWLISQDLGTETTTELLVWDLTFNGETNIELGGGNIGWAAGIQARNEQFEREPEDINNLDINPCPFTLQASVDIGFVSDLNCASPTGLFAFLSGNSPTSTERTVYGSFLELALPFSDTFDAQLAVRYEDYGGNVGDTIDPKLALRWQATDWLAFRGSVSSTFRGPPQPFLDDRVTSLQFVGPVVAFKAVDTLGNADLDPETAITTNFGVIIDTDRFYGSVDYWSFDFEDPFQIENFNGILGAYGANGCTPGGAGVGSTVCNQLGSSLVFQAGSAGNLADIERLEVSFINGTDIKTSGIDWLAQYDFDVGGGLLTIGTQGTHTLEYEVDDFESNDGIFLLEGGDFAGNLNDNNNSITPVVDLQANVFAKFSAGRHRAQLIGRYWGEYEDPSAIPALQDIDDMLTVDFTYNLALMEDQLNVNFSVFNMFDEDPPATQTDLNYDPYTHSAFGRMIKVGLTYRFGGQ